MRRPTDSSLIEIDCVRVLGACRSPEAVGSWWWFGGETSAGERVPVNDFDIVVDGCVSNRAPVIGALVELWPIRRSIAARFEQPLAALIRQAASDRNGLDHRLALIEPATRSD